MALFLHMQETTQGQVFYLMTHTMWMKVVERVNCILFLFFFKLSTTEARELT